MSHDEQNKEPEFEWKRLFLRKDRPLPKAGCSWAFYIFLLALIAFLTIMYIKYRNQ